MSTPTLFLTFMPADVEGHIPAKVVVQCVNEPEGEEWFELMSSAVTVLPPGFYPEKLVVEVEGGAPSPVETVVQVVK
jgi:hypothetical protein